MKSNKVLDYRVHIEKETDGKKTVYNAFCPALGLADFGRTIDEALEHITDLISFHIETLTQLGRSGPMLEKYDQHPYRSTTRHFPRAHFVRSLSRAELMNQKFDIKTIVC